MSQFGAVTVPETASVVFVESAQADDLAARVNAAILAIFADEDAQFITSITLAGGGDGHTFVVAIEHAPEDEVAGGLASPVTVVCYLASENEALTVARAAVAAGALIPIIDEQIAGAAKGTRFMGMMVTSNTLPAQGATGPTGPSEGPEGPTGPTGPSDGPTGPTGPGVGATGPTGASGGGGLEFGSFFALMPGDNTDTIAINAPLLLPQDGPASGIVRSSPSEFVLPTTGIYKVAFQASFDEAGQLALDLNGTLIGNTVAGRATGTNQISNTVMIAATALDVLRVINGASAAALTVTPTAGGTNAVSAWLVIERVG